MKNGYSVAAMLITILFLLSLAVQPVSRGLSVDVQEDLEMNGQFEVNIDWRVGRTEYSKNMTAVCFPVDRVRSDPIYLFANLEGGNGSAYSRSLGLLDHLEAYLSTLDSDTNVELVDEGELKEVFSGGNATVIITSQPSEDPELGMKALEWVRGGGNLIGIGNRSVPFISEFEGGEWRGPEQFLKIRYERFSFGGAVSWRPSEIARAMDFQYVAPSLGIRVDDVEKSGGRVIGYVYEDGYDLTSSALFRIGEGAVLAFSGHIETPILTSGEEALSGDIAKIVLSSLHWISGDIVYETRSAGSQAIEGTLSAEYPVQSSLSFVIFDSDDHQNIFYSQVFNGPNSI